MIGTAAVQAEIYRQLTDAAIVPVAHVVDGPVSDPKLIDFPYLQLADTQTIDDDVIGRAGSEEFLSLHIWSRHRGQSEVKTLAGQVAALFGGKRLSITGYGSVDVFVRDLRVLGDPDGLTAHGVLTLTIHAFGEGPGDLAPPTVVSFSPLDNATGVAVSANLVATMSETVVLGTGIITLKKSSDNSTVDSWNVATAGGSTAGKVEVVSGNQLTMHPTASLANGIEYYVIWNAGVVKDASGNPIAAQASTTLWSFTTVSAVAAGYDIFVATGDSNKFYGSPLVGGTDVGDARIFQLGITAPNANVVMLANEPLDTPNDNSIAAGHIGHDVHFVKDYYMANGLLLGARNALIVQYGVGGSYVGNGWGAPGGSAGNPTTPGVNLAAETTRIATALALSGTNVVKAVLDMDIVNLYSAYGNTPQTGLLENARPSYLRLYQYLRNLVGPTVPILISRMTKQAIDVAGVSYSTNGRIADRIIQSIPLIFPYFAVADSQSPTELIGDVGADKVHFTAAEQRLLAGRYYTAYLAAQANSQRVLTWNPYDAPIAGLNYAANAGFTWANSNLDLSGDATAGWKTARATAPLRSGKAYAEVKVQVMASGVNLGYLGLCNADYLTASYLGQAGGAGMSAGQWGGNPTNDVFGYTKVWTGTASWVVNDIIQLAVDMSSGKAWIGKNGAWYNSGNPAAGTGEWISGIIDPIFIAASIYSGTGNTYRLQPTAGSFTYTPPAGFSAWGA